MRRKLIPGIVLIVAVFVMENMKIHLTKNLLFVNIARKNHSVLVLDNVTFSLID